jgi:hypothetical protein
MKITIDTVQKTIVLEEDVSLKELLSYLVNVKDEKEAEEYIIKRTKEYIYIPQYPVYPVFPYYPVYPQFPVITYGDIT